MKHRLLYIPIVFLLLLTFSDCAKRGRPSGGKRDSIPPVIVKSTPENFSINFDSEEIRIEFDEYIKLNDLQQNLIISPPLKYNPIITPLGTSKQLRIKILDTLKENTTYSFNFGKSIVDNNEGNEFEYYKYVFSTGSYIDSLSLSGTVKDALLLNPETKAAVMLYEVGETFSDSIVFSEKPTYIATSRDSTHSFELTNLKAGTYMLMALQEENNDFIFQPKKDRVGFVKEFITIPNDSTYTLTLFKEIPDYAPGRPSQVGKNHILFGYEGKPAAFTTRIISETPEDYTSTTYKDLKKDTLHYWFKPAIEADSLLFLALNGPRLDTLNVRMKDLYADSLQFSPVKTGIMIPRDTVRFAANIPLTAIDPEKIKVTDKDTLDVPSTAVIDPVYNTVGVVFDKGEENSYKIDVLPGAVTDFFGATNDSLQYAARTRSTSDYGTIRLNISRSSSVPILVQLVDTKFELIYEQYLTNEPSAYFDYVPPGVYYIRVIMDDNENGKWDTGNFLRKEQPERVIYFPGQISLNVNWDWVETFTLN